MAQQASGMQNIISLVDLFKPKGGSSVTETNKVSSDAVNSIVKTILESNQGLAAIASGQKAAGLYNSSTNQLLLNDLTARTAGEAAKLNSSRTTTTAPQGQLDPKKTAVGMLGLKLIAPTIKAASKKFGTDTIGDKIADSIFGGGGSGGASSAAADLASSSSSSLGGFDLSAAFGGAGAELTSSFGGDLATELASSFGSDVVADAGSALVDSYANVAADSVTNFLFANGGRVPTKKNYANGGAVKQSIIKRQELPKKKNLESEASGLNDMGANVNIGANPAQALSAFGSLALGAMIGGPSIMGMANAVSNANTGTSLLGNLVSVISSFADAQNVSSTYGSTAYGFGADGQGAGFGGDNTGGFGGIGGTGEGAAGDADDGVGGGVGVGDGATGMAANGGKIFRTPKNGSVAINNSSTFKGDIPGHDTEGKDNIQINVSGGEYVLPTDVVDVIGEDVLDALVAALHTPIKK